MDQDHMAKGRFETGYVLGERYRVAGLIGRGGMSKVYAVEDLRLQGKLRALKVNRPPTADGLYGAEEAALLMRLSHPRLPAIVDYFPPDGGGSEMLVTDYIDGQTLQTYMHARGGVLPAAETIGIGIQLCEALHYLHMQSPPVIHRDLKPTNVMIDGSGSVRLIDFGIARRYKAGKAGDTLKLGTPGFAAPEQEDQRPHQSDPRTDVYGLGALLHYLLTGTGPKSVSELSGLTLPATAAVIRGMTDVRPACRFPSIESVKAALQSCLEKEKEADVHRIQGRSQAAVAAANVGVKHHGRDGTPVRRLDAGSIRYAADGADPFRITVASLASGAGATFTAITLARLIGMRGIACAAVEHPSLEPEWHALLDYARKKPAAAEFGAPIDPRYARLNEDGVLWHMLRPDGDRDGADDMLKHRLMTDSLRGQAVITDVSALWMESGVTLQIRDADLLLIVTDPFPAKWSPARLRTIRSVCFERESAGRPTRWIANKDCRFQGRSDWLSMLPNKPCAVIPYLPYERWMDTVWHGRWATADKTWRETLVKAFGPLIDKLFT